VRKLKNQRHVHSTANNFNIGTELALGRCVHRSVELDERRYTRRAQAVVSFVSTKSSEGFDAARDGWTKVLPVRSQAA
jgi:hypothetical protein